MSTASAGSDDRFRLKAEATKTVAFGAREDIYRGFRLQPEVSAGGSHDPWHAGCSLVHMAYSYPPHHHALTYIGRQDYFLTFCTDQRRQVFTDVEAVNLVGAQFLRAAGERQFEMTAYCFMPDHVHLLIHGLGDGSDCKAFIRAAKQYSGFYFNRSHHHQLWQRYGFERVIRDDRELALTVGYIVANPVRAGLVEHPSTYPHLGSQRYTVSELLEICEYDRGWG